MSSVLITAIGGDIGQSVAKIVREAFPRMRILGSDIAREHGGGMFVDELVRLPAAADGEYPDALAQLIARQKIDYVLPMSEAELEVLAPAIEAKRWAHWISAGARVIRCGVDKLETMRALQHLGVTVPWTRGVGTGLPAQFPCILKERRGSGSRGVFVVNDAEEARFLAERHPDAVYQELLEPAESEVTCAVYRRADGAVATLLMRRRLMGGFTGWAQIIDDRETEVMCRQVACGLGLRGAMNIQLRLTADGPRIFEINPRYSSTVLMRHKLGFTDVVWAFQELEGRAVSFPRIETGTVIVRTQDAAVLPRTDS